MTERIKLKNLRSCIDTVSSNIPDLMPQDFKKLKATISRPSGPSRA